LYYLLVVTTSIISIIIITNIIINIMMIFVSYLLLLVVYLLFVSFERKQVQAQIKTSRWPNHMKVRSCKLEGKIGKELIQVCCGGEQLKEELEILSFIQSG
jgi:hypothetical protein